MRHNMTWETRQSLYERNKNDGYMQRLLVGRALRNPELVADVPKGMHPRRWNAMIQQARKDKSLLVWRYQFDFSNPVWDGKD